MAEQFEFWIGETRLPVTPGELSISNGVNIEKVDLADGNKLTRFVGKELATISFTASFPTVNQNRPHYAFSDISDPLHYWNKFRNLMVNGTEFELVIMRKPNVDEAIIGWYLINSMDEKYSADKGSEMEISFELIKYVAPTTVRVVQIPQKKEQTWIDTFGKNLADMNESAKKYLKKLGTNLKNEIFRGAWEYELSNRLDVGLIDMPEFHIVSGENETFITLAMKYYKDVGKAHFIRELNNFRFLNHELNGKLPKGERIRLRYDDMTELRFF